MTSDEVEASIQPQIRNKVRIHRLEERVGDSVALLSYTIDAQNKMTIWHTEVPPLLQHMGVGGRLLEEAVQLASRDSSRFRRHVSVCEGTFSSSSRAQRALRHSTGRGQPCSRPPFLSITGATALFCTQEVEICQKQ
jgi:predicted GNAT family acetyltransferase